MLILSSILGSYVACLFYFKEKRQGARGDSLVCGACGQVCIVD
jgi:hypothetical protein